MVDIFLCFFFCKMNNGRFWREGNIFIFLYDFISKKYCFKVKDIFLEYWKDWKSLKKIKYISLVVR